MNKFSYTSVQDTKLVFHTINKLNNRKFSYKRVAVILKKSLKF